MGLFDIGRKHGNRFVEMLVGLAGGTRASIAFLEAALEHGRDDEVQKLRDASARVIEERRVLIDELHRTFITPIDREDIYNLSYCFEKMALYALTTLEEMRMLRVAPDQAIREMVVLVREQAESLEHAMEHLMRNPRVADEHAHAVHEREHRVEQIYRTAIHDLFARAGEPAALPGVFYRREVYRHISNMADRAVSAANVLGMVVMKLA